MEVGTTAAEWAAANGSGDADGSDGGRGGGGASAREAAGCSRAAGMEQWRGAMEAALPGTPAGAAWPHVARFCSAHRYLPGIDVCERVSPGGGGGEEEEELPGCVRHVASLATGLWAREELLEADHAARRLRYAVVDSNMGFGRYAATLRVLADRDDDDAVAGQRGGCRISWAFECDAVQAEGWSEAALVARLDVSVKGMAVRVQQAVRAGLDNVSDKIATPSA